jgi:acetyl-CoA carboxylase biotin carboxyl carrier protein
MARGRGTMDSNKLKELRELVDFLKENGIAEFDMERTDLKVRIKFAGAAGSTAADLALAQQLAASAAGSLSSLGAATTELPSAAAEEMLHEVKSPIVGTFYDSPSPGAPAFVQAGDQVEAGQVLCIVEAMKLMNEIECDIAGEIVKRIAVTGQPVEFGQPLFAIRPR